MNFVADALFDGRMRTVANLFAGECLAIGEGLSLKEEDVVITPDAITAQRGLPRMIHTDDGSDFVFKVMDQWACERGMALGFSRPRPRPSKPTDNAAVERSKRRLRQQCSNAHWVLSSADAQARIGAWCKDSHESRPQSALGWATLAELAPTLRPAGSCGDVKGAVNFYCRALPIGGQDHKLIRSQVALLPVRVAKPLKMTAPN